MSKVGSLGVSLSLSLGLLVGGCTKTVEGENKAWERNLAKVGEVSAIYPSFSAALAEQKKKAEEAMTAAKAVSDKEQSAKKMAEANGMLDNSFVSTLAQLDARSKSLRTKLISATVEAEHGSDQAGARAAVEDAQRILRNFDEAIKTGAPNADAAGAVVRKLDGDLSSAASNVDKVVESAKKRKAEADKAAGAAKGAAPTTTAGAAVAPVPAPQWQCKFCKHMNDASRTTCSECGGSKPAPGAAAPGKPAPPPPGKPAPPPAKKK